MLVALVLFACAPASDIVSDDTGGPDTGTAGTEDPCAAGGGDLWTNLEDTGTTLHPDSLPYDVHAAVADETAPVTGGWLCAVTCRESWITLDHVQDPSTGVALNLPSNVVTAELLLRVDSSAPLPAMFHCTVTTSAGDLSGGWTVAAPGT